MTLIWGWIPVVLLLIILTGERIFEEYKNRRIQSVILKVMHPEQYADGYQMNATRQAISKANLIGGTTDFTLGYNIPNLSTEYILTYVICTFGIVVGILIIGLFFALVGRMIYISMKQKNSLGMFVGIGCSLVFAVQGIIYILSNLGFQVIAQVNLPFVSYSETGLITNFIVLGIMLSVFRNANIVKEVPYKKRWAINLVRVK